MKPTAAAEQLAASIANLGITHLFCLMGEANLEFIAAARARGMTIIHGRHEQGVVGMADGYARFSRTGLPSVCTVTSGPGLTNTATSIRTAAEGKSRVLLVAGDTPRGAARPGAFSQAAFTDSLGALSLLPNTAQELLEHTQQGIDYLLEKTGVVALHVPGAIWAQPLASEQCLTATRRPNSASPTLIEQAAELIATSKRPAILAGRGASMAGAEEALTRLAEHLGAPIATTVAANGFAGDSRHSAGIAGSVGSGQGSEALHQADCVIAVGTSLTHWTTDEGTAIHGKPVIRIDDNPADEASTGLLLAGDARLVVEALNQRIGAAGAPWFNPAAKPPIDFEDGEQTLDPRRVLIALDNALPKERAIVLDGGQHANFALHHLRMYDAHNFGWTSDFGAIGQGLSFAIGAAIARPNERVTAVMGDGGFMMAIAELDTAVRHNVPLTVFVLNDEGYGQERGGLAAKGLPPQEADIPTPDIAALAEQFGATGYRIDSIEALDNLEQLLQSTEGPLVFDVRINGSVRSDFHARIAAHHRAAQKLRLLAV